MTRVAIASPLVAVVCCTPIIAEALAAALDGFAEVKSFPGCRGLTAALLGSMQPDAVIVESDEDAAAAAAYTRGSKTPVVHISLADQRLRIWRQGSWTDQEAHETSPEAVRNAVLSSLYAREVAR
ncbi:MAG: hypothetical protein ABI649_10855 [Gaiellaceae bacterium]